MITGSRLKKLRGRIAMAGVKQRDLAKLAGYSETMFSLYLNGLRPAPPDFENRVNAALDKLVRAEKAAQKAREKVLAEGA